MILLLFLLVPPLKPPLVVTSGFGSYRIGHFHAGVDLSTNRKTGKPVYAVFDGEIFRIRASYTGYGKAIYLRNRKGEVVVYAHLSRFTRKLERKLRYIQKKRKSYFVDTTFQRGIKVREGEIIGYSGASGAGPPHLHFEYRDREGFSKDPLEILGIEDSLDLEVRNVLLRSSNNFPWEEWYHKSRTDTLIVSSAFLPYVDISEPYKNGYRRSGLPKSVRLLLDGDTIYSLDFDEISPTGRMGEGIFFKEGVPLLALYRPYFLKWSKVKGLIHVNPEPGYHTLEILLEDDRLRSYKIPIWVDTLHRWINVVKWDWEWNGYKFRFFKKGLLIKGKGNPVFMGTYPLSPFWVQGDTNYFWMEGNGNWTLRSSGDILNLESFWIDDSISIPLFGDGNGGLITFGSGCVAEPFLLWRIELPPSDPKKGLIPMSTRVLFFPKDPLLIKPIYLYIVGDPNDRKGLFERRSWGWWFLGKDGGKVWDLGVFSLFRDTVQPFVEIVSFRRNSLFLHAGDYGSGVDPSQINAYLDGRWIPIDYDPDTGSLSYIPLRGLPQGNHRLKIVLRDKVGNERRFLKSFFVR